MIFWIYLKINYIGDRVVFIAKTYSQAEWIIFFEKRVLFE